MSSSKQNINVNRLPAPRVNMISRVLKSTILCIISVSFQFAYAKDDAGQFVKDLESLKKKNASPEKIIALCSQGLSIDPNNVSLLAGRGAAYRRIAEYDLALKDLNKTISLDPNNFEALKTKGFLFQAQGKPDKAVDEYSKALAAHPNAMVYVRRGVIFQEQKHNDKALADFDKAYAFCKSKQSPGDRDGINDVLMARSRLNFKLGRLDKALADCNEGLKLVPTSRKLLEVRGSIYEAQHDYKKALSDYDRFIETKPNHVRGYEYRASVFDKMADFENALKEWNKCIRLDPEKPKLYYERAKVYAKLKKPDLAAKDRATAEKLEAALSAM